MPELYFKACFVSIVNFTSEQVTDRNSTLSVPEVKYKKENDNKAIGSYLV